MTDKRYLAFASFALAAIFGYLETFRVELTNDTNYFMHCAWRLWTYGPSKLYSLCTDENFPYHMVFYSPLAGLASSYHIEPAIVLHTACCICGIISLVVLSRALKAQGVSRDDQSLWLAISAFALFVVPCVYGVFADREHFLFIFALPWMLQMLLGLRPLNYTCVMAAFGFLMKPHDYVLFGVMTLTAGPVAWSLWQRLFSVSARIMYAAGALYVAAIWIFFPDFLFDVLPMALVVYPTKYFTAAYKINFAAKYIVLATTIVLTFANPWRMKIPWFGFIAGCTAVLFLNAGWDYTFYLVAMPMVLAFALPWLTQYGGTTESQANMVRAVRWLMVGMVTICIYSIGSEMGVLHPTHFRNHNTVIPALRTAMQQEAGDKIIILSLNVWESQVEPFAGKPEAVYGYDDIWTYRWLGNHEWDPHYPKIQRALASSFLTAITQNPTAVIFADISPEPTPTPDGPLGFLMRDPQIRAEMSHYVPVKDMDYCSGRIVTGCRFVVLKREDAPAP